MALKLGWRKVSGRGGRRLRAAKLGIQVNAVPLPASASAGKTRCSRQAACARQRRAEQARRASFTSKSMAYHGKTSAASVGGAGVAAGDNRRVGGGIRRGAASALKTANALRAGVGLVEMEKGGVKQKVIRRAAIGDGDITSATTRAAGNRRQRGGYRANGGAGGRHRRRTALSRPQASEGEYRALAQTSARHAARAANKHRLSAAMPARHQV